MTIQEKGLITTIKGDWGHLKKRQRNISLDQKEIYDIPKTRRLHKYVKQDPTRCV